MISDEVHAGTRQGQGGGVDDRIVHGRAPRDGLDLWKDRSILVGPAAPRTPITTKRDRQRTTDKGSVGWRIATHMRTDMVLDAIEMARWSRGTRLTGTVADSYDNALAETVNGYYKAELIRGPARRGPWKTVEDVELATLGWVHWHNTTRLHGYLHDVPPGEYEAAFYAATGNDHTEVDFPTFEPL